MGKEIKTSRYKLSVECAFELREDFKEACRVMNGFSYAQVVRNFMRETVREYNRVKRLNQKPQQ